MLRLLKLKCATWSFEVLSFVVFCGFSLPIFADISVTRCAEIATRFTWLLAVDDMKHLQLAYLAANRRAALPRQQNDMSNALQADSNLRARGFRIFFAHDQNPDEGELNLTYAEIITLVETGSVELHQGSTTIKVIPPQTILKRLQLKKGPSPESIGTQMQTYWDDWEPE